MSTKTVLIVVTAVVVIAAAVLLLLRPQAEDELRDITPPPNQDQRDGVTPQARDWLFDSDRCSGEGTVELTNIPMQIEDFSSLIPYGLMTGSHVTPIDHQYFSPSDYNSPRDAYEVTAVADGTILEIQHRTGPPQDGRILSEFRIVFEHTCTFLTYMDLVTSLDPAIMEVAGDDIASRGHWSGRIPVKSGQSIGKIGGQTLDFGVYNKYVTLGFVNPESYDSEPWKIHTDESIQYFSDDLQAILVQKNLRKVEPIDGRIDYDIDGKLIGNWFKEGTGGYGGTNRDKYWEGHLSIVYDHIDPDQIIVSIGDFDGESVQGAVGEGGLDPATVSIANGLVAYELFRLQTYNKDGGDWEMNTVIPNPGIKAGQELTGTILVEMIEDRKIRVEVFPRQAAEKVNGFTDQASVYLR